MNTQGIPPDGIPVNPAIDISQFEPIAGILADIAHGKGGKFVVVGIEAATEELSIHHIANDGERTVFKLLEAVELEARRPGWNVYYQQSLVREDLEAWARGTEKDTTGVMVLVLEFDDKHQPATRHERLPLHPHAEVESSPGRYHCKYFLDRIYSVDELKPVLAVLVDKAGCDTAKSLEHLFRVPGTLNWPDQRKLDAGRSEIPAMATLTLAPDPDIDRISLDELKAAMIAKWGEGVFSSASPSAGEFDWEQRKGAGLHKPMTADEVKAILDAYTVGKRSQGASRFIREAWNREHTPQEIAGMMLEHRKTRVMQRYKSDDHVRKDVRRVVEKLLAAPAHPPQWDKLAEETAASEAAAGTSEAREPLLLSRKTPTTSAAHFVARNYRGAELVHYQGEFFAYTGTHYAVADDARLRSEIYPFLEAAFEGDKPFDPNISKVHEVLAALKAATHISSSVRTPAWVNDGNCIESDLYTAGDLISCKNGLLHLPTRELIPHTPSLFTLNALDFAYERRAPTPMQWLAFLNSIWPDDQEAIDTLQEMFGYFLSGDLRQEKAFLIVGPKRGGKGTIRGILTNLLGAANVVNPTLAGLSQNFGLAPLIGKKAAIIADARLGGRIDQHLITERLLTISGRDSLTIDRKHVSQWTGQLGVRFLILSNELPRLADASGTLASRFIILMMHESFYGREDLTLYNRLCTELPGILNWALTGWDRLTKRRHFKQPKSSAGALQQLEDLTSPIGAFIRERCRLGGQLSVSRDKLYAAWEQWCRRGNQPIGSRETFGRDLRAAAPRVTDSQPRIKGVKVRLYRGIELRND